MLSGLDKGLETVQYGLDEALHVLLALEASLQ